MQWFLQILVQTQLRLWKKPVNVTRFLFAIWQSGVIPDDWKNLSVAPMLKKNNTYRVVGLSTVSGKIMEQIILEAISEHMRDKKMLRIASRALLMTNYACLLQMTDSVNKRNAVNVA